jgi:hypothetical protein
VDLGMKQEDESNKHDSYNHRELGAQYPSLGLCNFSLCDATAGLLT